MSDTFKTPILQRIEREIPHVAGYLHERYIEDHRNEAEIIGDLRRLVLIALTEDDKRIDLATPIAKAVAKAVKQTEGTIRMASWNADMNLSSAELNERKERATAILKRIFSADKVTVMENLDVTLFREGAMKRLCFDGRQRFAEAIRLVNNGISIDDLPVVSEANYKTARDLSEQDRLNLEKRIAELEDREIMLADDLRIEKRLSREAATAAAAERERLIKLAETAQRQAGEVQKLLAEARAAQNETEKQGLLAKMSAALFKQED
jgi:hypothetical protein